jgi:arylsulfatase
MPPRKPNFLLFITDQHRADHLGAYGNTIVQTPHIDRLARKGWVADRCYVASPICMPNRASLMTGRLPSVHGARHNGIPLDLAASTFVERLREDGYATALVGKSHLQNITGNRAIWPPEGALATQGEARRAAAGRMDQERQPSWDADPNHGMSFPFYGFEDVRLVINHGDTAAGDYKRWLCKDHPQWAPLVGPEKALPADDYELVRIKQAWRSRLPEELSTSSYIGTETCKKLEAYAQGSKPFFIQCSFPDPHHPFTPPGRYWDMYLPQDMPLPRSYSAKAGPNMPHLRWLLDQRDQGQALKTTPACFAATEREVQEALALNYGCITHLDTVIGQVLSRLEALGLSENTIVIFTADHGDFFGDHQLLWKGPLHFQGLTRVPFIWHDPGLNVARRSEQLCSTIDLALTILARAACVPYNGIQGENLLPVIEDNKPLARKELLIEEEGQRIIFGFNSRVRMRTLQTDRYRMSIYHGTDLGELYDLQTDPEECHNLWGDPNSETLRARLLDDLVRLMIGHADESPHPTALA